MTIKQLEEHLKIVPNHISIMSAYNESLYDIDPSFVVLRTITEDDVKNDFGDAYQHLVGELVVVIR